MTTATAPKIAPYTCGGCSSTWTGVSRAHCSACHRTFSTAPLFDTHRRQGHCLDPAGMAPSGHPLVEVGGVWCSSAPNVFAARRRAEREPRP